MAYLVRQARWWGLALVVCVLTGCTPISEMFGSEDPTGEPPVIPGAPAPDPEPAPAPEPDPDPAPNPEANLAIVVGAANLIIPEGETGSLSVQLSKDPGAELTVTAAFVTNDGSIQFSGTNTLDFTSQNWNQAQTLMLSALQDANATDGVAVVELTMAGADPVRVGVVASDDEIPQGTGVLLTVKDASGHGSVGSPVSAVVPLEYGKFQTTDSMRIRDASGNVVPAQISVLNRWSARDKSIRHVLAQFEASVAPFGTTFFFFRTDGGTQVTHPNSISVTDAADSVTVDTGIVRFRILKSGFNLFDEVYHDTNGDGAYAASERIVAPGSGGPVFTGRLAGDVQRASERANIKVVIEEEGPIRAVLRVSSLGKFTSTSDHDHGFAMRIYAYAGKSFVSVDYQLQNSAKNVRFSWPLYFEDVSLVMHTELSSPTVRFAAKEGDVWQGSVGSNGKHLFQSSLTDAVVRDSGGGGQLDSASTVPGTASFGWADFSDSTRGVAVVIRHMAEMWPNGIEILPGNDVAVRLWPKWSAQLDGAGTSSTGLYWLDDMQHVVKQALFFFHGAGVSNDDLDALAVNFQYHPVTFVALSEYRRTQATFDLDGFVPATVGSAGPDTHRVAPASDQVDPGSPVYAFGWQNFGGDTWRKKANNTGNYPESGTSHLVSGRTDQFFAAERSMWGDLNCRPIWMAEYDHDDDFALIKPTENPYGSESWRDFDGHGEPFLAAPYLSGTSWAGWYPRDNAHAWFYHIEDFYYSSGNPWVRDWYEWISEFRKRTLFQTGIENESDPFFEWIWSTRGEGHMLANSLQAYRVTGDAQLLAGLKLRLANIQDNWVDRRYGTFNPSNEAAFQVGFVARPMLGYLHELQDDPETKARAFLMLWGLMDWHYNQSQYAYDMGVGSGIQPSDGTALSMVDPSALWYLKTGQAAHRTLMLDYVSTGINGGQAAYGDFGEWKGAWEGRLYNYVKQQKKADETPASAITDLAASHAGGKVTIDWTAPAKAARYLVVWSTFPISRTYTTDASKRNAWGCNAVGTDLKAVPGSKQSLEFDGVPAGKTVYVAVYTFTADDNLSEASNIASVSIP